MRSSTRFVSSRALSNISSVGTRALVGVGVRVRVGVRVVRARVGANPTPSVGTRALVGVGVGVRVWAGLGLPLPLTSAHAPAA